MLRWGLALCKACVRPHARHTRLLLHMLPYCRDLGGSELEKIGYREGDRCHSRTGSGERDMRSVRTVVGEQEGSWATRALGG